MSVKKGFTKDSVDLSMVEEIKPVQPARTGLGAHDDGEEAEEREIIGRVSITYIGPVAPYWEFELGEGPEKVLASFIDRAKARLTMLPPYDRQFDRNSGRISQDAAREGIEIDWILAE